MTKLPTFLQALEGLGRTNQERADRLGVSVRSVDRYRAGELPRAEVLLQHPLLLRAIVVDAEALQPGPSAPKPRKPSPLLPRRTRGGWQLFNREGRKEVFTDHEAALARAKELFYEDRSRTP